MTMEMRLKVKYRSHKYDINNPKPIHGHKYTTYKMYLSTVMAICIKVACRVRVAYLKE